MDMARNNEENTKASELEADMASNMGTKQPNEDAASKHAEQMKNIGKTDIQGQNGDILEKIVARSPSLRAHESAVEFDSFSYSTLPNSASPDIFARWRHFRLNGGIHVSGLGRDSSDTWGEECCCKGLLRRRIVLFLVVLFTGIVMATVAIASVWITSGTHGKTNQDENSTSTMVSS